MPKTSTEKSEQAIWDLYTQYCKSEGKSPTPKDFANWAKSILAGK